jgi:hypothetical protein
MLALREARYLEELDVDHGDPNALDKQLKRILMQY